MTDAIHDKAEQRPDLSINPAVLKWHPVCRTGRIESDSWFDGMGFACCAWGKSLGDGQCRFGFSSWPRSEENPPGEPEVEAADDVIGIGTLDKGLSLDWLVERFFESGDRGSVESLPGCARNGLRPLRAARSRPRTAGAAIRRVNSRRRSGAGEPPSPMRRPLRSLTKPSPRRPPRRRIDDHALAQAASDWGSPPRSARRQSVQSVQSVAFRVRASTST